MSIAGPIPARVLEQALATVNIGCWHCIRRGDPPKVSNNFPQLIGCQPEALPTDRAGWIGLAHPGDQALFATLFEALEGEGTAAIPECTLRLRHGAGTWRRFEVRSGTDGEAGVFVTFCDITREWLARQHIEKNERIYRAVVQTSPDAILLIRPDGRLRMVNQQACRLFGLNDMDDPGEISIRALMPEETVPDFLANPEDCSGFIVTREQILRMRDGRSFSAATAHTALVDESGRPSDIILFVRDLTDQQHAERELEAHRANLEHLVQERTAQLETAHDALSKIIDGSPVPTIVLDTGHRVTHWNAACEQIIGIPAADMIGSRDCWRAFYSEARPILADLVVDGEPGRIAELYRGKYRPSSLVAGGYEAEDYFPLFGRWLFFTASPLRDQQGRIVGAIETLQDITERKLVENALIEAKQAAESAAETKAVFLANMSHEIRTPLNAVIGLGHLLLKSDLNDKQRDYVSRIHSAAQMLLDLINDILDFSKIEAGRMRLEETEFTLDGILDNISNVLLHRAHEKDIELQYAVAPDVPASFKGDPLRLTQILINLIGNALKFTAKGSVTLFVKRLSAADPASVDLELAVRDTGIGISPEQLRGLFQAFNQADTSTTRNYGGTGLGLTISKRLAEMMGGGIAVESELGVGSTFTVRVRLRPGDGAGQTPSSSLRRALIVDDNPLARTVLLGLFERHGCIATAAASGEEALSVLAADLTTPFEFVTIDLNMPGMDGLELAAAIKAQLPYTPKLVMVTATDTEALPNQERLSLFHAVFNKPVTKAQVGKLFAETRTARPSPSGSAALAGLRVLVVDDLPTNRLIAVEILESFGIIVDTAENGVQALKKLLADTAAHDVVLMDIQMPEMDGLEATRRLRATPRGARIPIIAMTAHAFDSERERCRLAGMDDFLTKPIDPELLQNTLWRWRTDLTGRPTAGNPELKESTMTTGDELPNLPGIDKAEGLRRMLNKSTLYEKILRDFHSRFSGEATAIRAALDSGDRAEAERRAHSTKGLAGSIGAAVLQERSLALESALRQNLPDVDARLAAYESELRRVLDGIAQGFGITPA